MYLYIFALSYRSWVKPLMYLLLFLSTLLYPYTLLGLGSNNRLALLRPVAVGDLLSPTTIGGYRNTIDDILEITKC
jgi:hypothetical protein